jgi:hypothetical protein
MKPLNHRLHPQLKKLGIHPRIHHGGEELLNLDLSRRVINDQIIIKIWNQVKVDSK